MPSEVSLSLFSTACAAACGGLFKERSFKLSEMVLASGMLVAALLILMLSKQ